MTAVTIAAARDAIAPYGYGLTDEGRFIHHDGRLLGVYLIAKGNRWHARGGPTKDYALLWSGADPARFVRDFWCATVKT